MLLKNRTAIIAGGSGGIGEETAKLFAQYGARVVVHYARSKEKAQSIVNDIELKEIGRAIAVKAEINEQEIAALAQECATRFGKIDILVNFLGYPVNEKSKSYWNSNFEDTTIKMYDDVFNVDFIGTLLFVKAVAPYMKKQRYGKIVNVSSSPVFTGDVKGHPFTPMKAAISSLTKNIAWELGEQNITVNAIAPGNILTGWKSALSEAEIEKAGKETAMKRWGRPDEIAKVALFLSSDLSSFVNGQTIVVDGGYVMR